MVYLARFETWERIRAMLSVPKGNEKIPGFAEQLDGSPVRLRE
jgi:hypothetical protein